MFQSINFFFLKKQKNQLTSQSLPALWIFFSSFLCLDICVRNASFFSVFGDCGFCSLGSSLVNFFSFFIIKEVLLCGSFDFVVFCSLIGSVSFIGVSPLLHFFYFVVFLFSFFPFLWAGGILYFIVFCAFCPLLVPWAQMVG